MIKFEKLTSEEVEYICGHIPPSAARQFFQKNPNSFAEIKSGFRPKLSDAETFSLLSKNVSKPFIGSFLEKMVIKWLDDIKESRNRLVDEGYSEEEALLITIPDSVFGDNCELYFKLIDQKASEDYVRLFREALSLRQKDAEERSQSAQEGEEQRGGALLEEAKKSIAALTEQLSDSKKSESSLISELDSANRMITAQKEEIDGLKKSIEEDDVIRAEMQVELEHYRRLASYSDEYVQEDTSGFQHVSLGQIYRDYNGQAWINRLADIVNGEIVPFVLDDSSPRYFSNRDRLFRKDGPEEDGFIGVWNWRADPNFSDSTKDYVTSKYSGNSKITEVIELPQCKNLTDISKLLTDWFEKIFTGEKVLFVCVAVNGTMEGVLCTTENMEIRGERARLLGSVVVLPHYTISPTDIISVGGLRIYRKMSLGIPQSIIRVRTPYDVVKKTLLSRVTISALREYGLTKREAQNCKHYLEAIPTETLIQNLADAYACTEAEAEVYVKGFIEHADTYLSDNDLDINIISLALARNGELVEQCKQLLTEEWKKEHSDQLAEAEKRLSEAKQEEIMARQETEALLQKKESITDEIQFAQQKMEGANQLAADVEKKIAERIKGAQQNAAEFISQMAFFTPFFNSSKNSVSEKQNSVPVFRSTMSHSDGGTVDDIDTFEEELIENLMATGYSAEIAVEMAQTISFCICSRLPIVVGENATTISQCVAATIGGEELTEVFAGNQPTLISSMHTLMEEKTADYPLVYLIHGVFDGYSINLFNEISNLIRMATTNVVVILSIQGIEPRMIGNSVWSGAFYIDGDSGMQTIAETSVHAVHPEMEFNRQVDTSEYKARCKELQPFSSVLSNKQICLYAKYLASYGVDLRDSPTILNQVIAVSRSRGLEEKLNDLFREYGINYGEEIIEQFL